MARILRIDHIAVAVKDVDAGVASYQKILGAELIEKAELSIMGNRMSAAYLKVGDGLVVLDGAVDPEGFIAKFIEKRGRGSTTSASSWTISTRTSASSKPRGCGSPTARRSARCGGRSS